MRRPENVHIYFYRQNDAGTYEYAIFLRADLPDCWQGVCGGVEDGETPCEAAVRECGEEAGVRPEPLYPLDTVSYMPSGVFEERLHWGDDVLVIPMWFFASPYDGPITLSEEHLEYRWLAYEEAYRLVYWHDQKTALWELHERLLSGRLARKEGLFRAGSSELETVAELAGALWPHHAKEELRREMCALLSKEDAAVWLWYRAGAPVGFAQCQIRREYVPGTSGGPVGYLEGIYVDAKARGTGIARALLAACEDWSREYGCTEFASDCELHNQISEAFHRKAGFQEAERVIHFWKKLSP